MIGNGIQEHLTGCLDVDGTSECGIFSICLWYDVRVTSTFGSHTLGSMH